MKYLAATAMLLIALAGGARAEEEKRCVVGGCSNQLCIEEGSGGMSTCEWSPRYQCYETNGICARQSDGTCGWTETDALRQCLANANKRPSYLPPQQQR